MKKKLPLIILVVALVGLAVLFLTRKNGPELAKNKIQQAAVKEMLANCKYDKDVCEYMAAQAQAMQEGVIITSTNKVDGYGTTTSEMKVDGEGNTEINTYKEDKLQSSMISLGDETYIKDLEDGAWYMMPVYDYEESEEEEDTLAEIKETYEFDDNMRINKVGTEACGNLTCDKYEMITVFDEEGQAATSYVWVDTKEHLARKMEYSYAGSISTMEYKYESVKVSKPSPIKEMPGMNYDGADDSADMEGMPSQEEIEQMMQEYSLDGE